ncbi:T9SS type A sorting domain-containing protein [Hymenobacter sp. YC55]|uniref:T9SS type A sorting domain-containing protein n=1 Tax=Hymenobacter sp. YC55 TaxID=3034019 RepID=UPI0023F8A8E6|nr:T9SS type A sorting domain-containing protein [Hymenobacter sp. YC55]MDF7812486.1 T9SS type A sorting domain-containing protein [Hymenobacter sp. YC55]
MQLTVNSLAVQPDGKILVAGGFDFVNGTLTGKLQRLNPDGTTDATFNVGGTGANGFISNILLQPDGKILVGGGFTTFNGQPFPLVVRLNSDGSVDQSFTFGTAASIRQITSLALQPDGKILVGSGTTFNGGVQTGGLVRLQPNGTVDSSFNSGTGMDQGGSVSTILVQADGKILIGGSFTNFAGQQLRWLVRLTSTGVVDPSFIANTTNINLGPISALAQQPDGKLLIGGSFTQVDGQPAARIARLLLDGTLDNSFQPGTGANNTVRSISLEPNGSIVIGGNFTQVNGINRGRVARLTSTGNLDTNFAAGVGASNQVNYVTTIPAGQVLVAGGFPQYNATSYGGIVRLNGTTGLPDAAFAPVVEARGILTQAVPLSNGQLLVTGNFTQFNGLPAPGSANAVRRINADGTLDASFVSQSTGAGIVQALQPNGSFYLLGNQLSYVSLQRQFASGAIDNSFNAQPFGPTTFSPGVVPAQLQGAVDLNNGQLLVFGRFRTYGGLSNLNGLVRLNADGTPDNTFATVSGQAARRVAKVLVQSSGKLLVVSDDFPNSSATTLERLNANGSPDNTFSVGTAAGTGAAYTVLSQPDGRLLVSGSFTTFNGQPAPYGVVRLTVDGSVDPTYSALADFYVLRAVQPDGRLLASRNSPAYSNTLVRLNLDGSLDASFNPIAVPQSIFTGDDVLNGIALQPTDGKIVLFGSFRYVAGQTRIGLARLSNIALNTHKALAWQPLELYPNPAHESVNLQLPAASKTRPATLVDLNGRTVRRWSVPAQQSKTQLSLNAVPAGVYLLQVHGESALYQQKVIVTH